MFGRFTAILQEHDHLGKTLGRLRRLCIELEAGAGALPAELAPTRLLDELHADLKEHFSAEESPEYFGTVVDLAPALAPQIAALKWKHLGLLSAVRRLRRIAADSDRWSELVLTTRGLVAEIERHEHAESVLLRQLFRPRP